MTGRLGSEAGRPTLQAQELKVNIPFHPRQHKSYADEAFERHLVAVLFYARTELSPAQRAVLVTELQKAVSEMDAEDAAAE